jgi:hypothetical protein
MNSHTTDYAARVMKTNTELVVTVERRETDYRLTWRQNEQHTREHLSEGKWVPSEESREICSTVSMDIFTKNKSTPSPRPSKDCLRSLIAPGGDKQDWQTRWDSKVSEYRELKERQRGLQAKTATKNR